MTRTSTIDPSETTSARYDVASDVVTFLLWLLPRLSPFTMLTIYAHNRGRYRFLRDLAGGSVFAVALVLQLHFWLEPITDADWRIGCLRLQWGEAFSLLITAHAAAGWILSTGGLRTRRSMLLRTLLATPFMVLSLVPVAHVVHGLRDHAAAVKHAEQQRTAVQALMTKLAAGKPDGEARVEQAQRRIDITFRKIEDKRIPHYLDTDAGYASHSAIYMTCDLGDENACAKKRADEADLGPAPHIDRFELLTQLLLPGIHHAHRN